MVYLLATTGTVISYAIYTVNSPLVGSQMMLTIPPAVYGIFRYLYLIYDRNDNRSMSGDHRRRPRHSGRRRRLRDHRLPAALRLESATELRGPIRPQISESSRPCPFLAGIHQVEAGAASSSPLTGTTAAWGPAVAKVAWRRST